MFNNNCGLCPWFDNDNCFGQIYYNQNVNDPRYTRCEEHTCPIFYWVKIVLEQMGGDNEN